MKKRRSNFWNKEYIKPEHLALSVVPSEDLQKFTRWLLRQEGNRTLNKNSVVLDLGCGNGRHLIYLNREFGCRGIGYDTSEEAIKQANTTATTRFVAAPLHFEVRSIAEPPPLADNSVDLVLDMMTAHVLRQAEREVWRNEISRVLRPGGWFFLKTFLAEEDLHVKRLLRDHPAGEANSYIHPVLGVYEHVWAEPEIEEFFGGQFEVAKIDKSHKHVHYGAAAQKLGRAFKRRFMVVYLRKKDFN